MTAAATWQAGQNNEVTGTYDFAAGRVPPGAAVPDEEPAHLVISEMADLVRDTRGNVITNGCILSAIMIGLALETGLSARVPRPGLAGVLNVGLLGGLLVCWLAAAVVLAWAGRPVLKTVSQIRWVTGSPLDPRPGWLTLPPAGASAADWTWARAYLLLAAARLARYRMQFADVWTYLAGGCFVAWTAVVILGL